MRSRVVAFIVVASFRGLGAMPSAAHEIAAPEFGTHVSRMALVGNVRCLHRDRSARGPLHGRPITESP